MRISILTVCPEMMAGLSGWPVIARAVRKGLLDLEIVDIREYAPGSFRHVDDSPFGGGPGMILRCQPVLDALRAVKGEADACPGGAETCPAGTAPATCDTGADAGGGTPDADARPKAHTILFSPAGHTYCQKDAHRLAGIDHLVLVCGHYEGVDARILPFMDEEISCGDYILTGGEPAAMLVVDSVVRLLPGALRAASTQEESFENGLLEYPQYTQPAVCEGMEVPDVLRSGDHERIRLWRLRESLRLTLARRPDLLEGRSLTPEEDRILKDLKDGL